MKKHYLFTITFILLLSSSVNLQSQKSAWENSTITITGEPEADIIINDFYLNPSSTTLWNRGYKKIEKGFSHFPLGQTDSTGVLSLLLNHYVYKKAKKDIIAVKSGYEPELLNIDLKKKTGSFKFSKPSEFTASEYWDLAVNEKNDDKQIEYYKKAIFQDYRNEEGIAAYAWQNMGIIYHQKEKFYQADYCLNMAKKIDPLCGADDYLAFLNEDIDIAIIEQERKREKAEKRNEIVKSVAEITLTATTTAIEILEQNNTSGNTGTSEGSSTSSSSNKSVTKGSTNKSSGNDLISKNADSRTYSRAESELSKMKSGLVPYDEKIKQNHQRNMRQIRQKWEGRGYSMFHSSLEDW